MITAIFGVVSLAAQVALGCVKLAYGATKLGYKVSKGLAKGSWKLAKVGKKLGKKVIKTINNSRVMARDNIPSPIISSSHIFTKHANEEKLIKKSRVVDEQTSNIERPKPKLKPKKSYIFSKKQK